MSLTPHQAKYFAHDLTRRASSGMDRLSMALFDAAVDLNPHQIEAALFALQSPLSKGVILADEVGLGDPSPVSGVRGFATSGRGATRQQLSICRVQRAGLHRCVHLAGSRHPVLGVARHP